MAYGLQTHHGPLSEDEWPDVLHDLNPVFDDYIVTYDDVAKVDDKCRHLWTAQHKTALQRVQNVGVHDLNSLVPLSSTHIDHCGYTKAKALRELGLMLEGKVRKPDPKKKRLLLLMEKLEYLL